MCQNFWEHVRRTGGCLFFCSSRGGLPHPDGIASSRGLSCSEQRHVLDSCLERNAPWGPPQPSCCSGYPFPPGQRRGMDSCLCRNAPWGPPQPSCCSGYPFPPGQRRGMDSCLERNAPWDPPQPSCCSGYPFPPGQRRGMDSCLRGNDPWALQPGALHPG